MLNKILFSATLFVAVISCNSSKKQEEPKSDMDVAQAFIRSTLDNNTAGAEKVLLKDKQNMDLLETYSRSYQRQPKEKTDCYQKSDVILDNIEVVADSVHIIYYRNACENNSKNKLKLVRIDGKWLVDFKYTLSGNL